MSFEDILKRGEREIDDLLHRDRQSQTPAPGPVTLAAAPPPQEAPVSLLTEAKTILHDGLAKLESVDEDAVNVLEAVKANPTAVSITNTLASVAHLPDPQGLLSSADTLLKSFAGILAQGAQDTAQGIAPADPSFTPAGPSVAGQA